MLHGNVKWFDISQGLGSIEPESGREVLVDSLALKRSGIDTLSEGQLVMFDLAYRKGQAIAEDLKVL
ncbi:cold shock domain-containing protein [Roseibium sediminis]|uniref:cold shock domain-containing protein n=1 Tax=Roseibium sediminis TaxID=1775174 RepID=UPI00123CD478|nr:cold shock domain-containing protein [Roseibium sediminis]